MKNQTRPSDSTLVAGILLGCGLGAFFDGILLHQILQWHNMLSSVTPPTDLLSMKYNMLYDGLFHAAAWLITTAGVAWLWHARGRNDVKRSDRRFVGALLVGWGAFNLVEGLIDHQLLGIHHVHPGQAQLAWDIGFLVWGGVMFVAGALLARRARSRVAATIAM